MLSLIHKYEEIKTTLKVGLGFLQCFKICFEQLAGTPVGQASSIPNTVFNDLIAVSYIAEEYVCLYPILLLLWEFHYWPRRKFGLCLFMYVICIVFLWHQQPLCTSLLLIPFLLISCLDTDLARVLHVIIFMSLRFWIKNFVHLSIGACHSSILNLNN